jgi:succinyl-CoA synthetase alpha subunit
VPVWNFVRRSVYQDSITLMRLSRVMEAVACVRRAAAMMGTPANRALLRQAGLLDSDGETAGPADLVIAIVADTAAAAEGARAAAERALTAETAAPSGGRVRPRTLAGGLRALPDATLALISVPGTYAGAEARRALDAGLHVMLFSDNVPLAVEVELKRLASERGLLVMGPDCGTAIVAGAPLGFANAVPRGRIGLVAASGTGLQEVSCRLAAEGEGVSHAIGVGGRDLSDAVGGSMTLSVLRMLAEDVQTEVVVVVGKPPGPAVVIRLADTIRGLGKPTVVHFAGVSSSPQLLLGGTPLSPSSSRGSSPLVATATLEDAALAAVALARGATPRPVEFTRPAAEIETMVVAQVNALAPGQRFVRGLYCGGTLAWEAVALLSARLPGVAADVQSGGAGHRVIDLGGDTFTVGRPHPMIDGVIRREWIAREVAEPDTGVLLFDLVLGHGAHPDPAAELAPALASARRSVTAAGRGLALIASVTGTEHDPQVRSRQAAALREAGVLVMDSNAQAARMAGMIAARAVRRAAP